MTDSLPEHDAVPFGDAASTLGDQALAAAYGLQEQTLAYRTDAEDRLEWITTHGAQLLGYADGGQLLGRPASILYQHAGDRAELLEAFAARGGVIWRDETLRLADGTTVAARTRLMRRRDAAGVSGGTEVRSLVFPGEIAARLCLARALREMEAIFNNALVGMILVRGGRIEKINSRGADIFGHGVGELAGADVEVLFRDARAYDSYRAEADKALATSGAHVGECEFVRKDGSCVLVRNHAKAIHAGDQTAGVVWAFEDITESRRLEEALRTSKKAAEAANVAKAQFLANMSHELRTPLNGIFGLAQLLLDTAENGETREYLHTIRQAASTLMRIVGDLLDLSNVEAGRLRIEEREFDPRRELEPLLRNLDAQSQSRAFVFSSHIDAKLPQRLRGDPERIKQIVLHLVGNAFKYTQQGMVTVRVGGREVPTGRGAVRSSRLRLQITVSDTGIGIDPTRLETIFEPFGIGENYLTKKYSGVGLGLTIARKLATMMGGSITVESEPGVGSTFLLSLECAVPYRAAPPVQAGTEPPETAPAGCLHILLAEDEPVNRIFTARALEKLGHTVHPAADGQEALEQLGQRAFDLVLLDIQMPRVNGLEVARRIRAGRISGLDVAIPIVALTAYALEADRQRGFDAGMDEYVTKPFEVAELVAAMERVLAKRRVREAQGIEASRPR